MKEMKMGDIGEYWKDHKEYVWRKKLGMSEREYKNMKRDIAQEKKDNHLAKCTIKCECGKMLLDTNAHNCHKQKLGRKGHKAIPIEKMVYLYEDGVRK